MAEFVENQTGHPTRSNLRVEPFSSADPGAGRSSCGVRSSCYDMRAMKCVARAPHRALARYVSRYLHLSFEPGTYTLPANGRAGMIASTGSSTYLGTEDGNLAPATGWCLFGSFSRRMIVRCTEKTDVVAVQFLPGGTLPFFPASGEEIRDRIFAVDRIVGTRSRLLAECTLSTDPGLDTADLLDNVLLALFDERRTIDTRVGACLAHIAQRGGDLDVTSLAEYAGTSTRHLERLFLEGVGLGPKRVCRITRLWSALSHFDRTEYAPGSRWAEVALAHGYSDQAHLVRECVYFTGKPPVRYLSERSPALSSVVGY